MGTMDKVVEAHQAIKAARAARRRAWEKEDLALEEDQNKLKVWMLEQLNATGTKSMACDHGTVYRREVTKAGAADWGAIWEWMKEHDAADLLERRLKVGFIQQYMEDNDGAIPPGINVHRQFEVSVRAPTTPSSKPGETADE